MNKFLPEKIYSYSVENSKGNISGKPLNLMPPTTEYACCGP